MNCDEPQRLAVLHFLQRKYNFERLGCRWRLACLCCGQAQPKVMARVTSWTFKTCYPLHYLDMQEVAQQILI